MNRTLGLAFAALLASCSGASTVKCPAADCSGLCSDETGWFYPDGGTVGNTSGSCAGNVCGLGCSCSLNAQQQAQCFCTGGIPPGGHVCVQPNCGAITCGSGCSCSSASTGACTCP